MCQKICTPLSGLWGSLGRPRDTSEWRGRKFARHSVAGGAPWAGPGTPLSGVPEKSIPQSVTGIPQPQLPHFSIYHNITCHVNLQISASPVICIPQPQITHITSTVILPVTKFADFCKICDRHSTAPNIPHNIYHNITCHGIYRFPGIPQPEIPHSTSTTISPVTEFTDFCKSCDGHSPARNNPHNIYRNFTCHEIFRFLQNL